MDVKWTHFGREMDANRVFIGSDIDDLDLQKSQFGIVIVTIRTFIGSPY